VSGIIRVGAAAAILGGALRIISTFIPWQADAAWLEALYGVIDLCLLVGLIGIHLATAEVTGTLGLIAFLIALAGIASIVGPDTVAFGIDFYRIGALVFVIGLAGLGALMWARGVLRITAAYWLLTLVSSLASVALPQAFLAAGLLLGAGYIMAGVEVWRGRGSR
jgi:hypothetical protein